MIEAKARATKVEAKAKEVTVSVGGKQFKLEAVEPKKAGNHAYVRYQPTGDCTEIAPFSTIYVPK